MLDFSSSPDPTCLTAWNREKVSLEKVEKSTKKTIYNMTYATLHYSVTHTRHTRENDTCLRSIYSQSKFSQPNWNSTHWSGSWPMGKRAEVPCPRRHDGIAPQKNKLRFSREALVIQCSSLNVLAVVTWWYRAIEIKDCYLLHKTKPNNGVMSHWMFRHQSLLRTLYMGYVGASLEWGGTSVLERVSATLL